LEKRGRGGGGKDSEKKKKIKRTHKQNSSRSRGEIEEKRGEKKKIGKRNVLKKPLGKKKRKKGEGGVFISPFSQGGEKENPQKTGRGTPVPVVSFFARGGGRRGGKVTDLPMKYKPRLWEKKGKGGEGGEKGGGRGENVFRGGKKGRKERVPDTNASPVPKGKKKREEKKETENIKGQYSSSSIKEKRRREKKYLGEKKSWLRGEKKTGSTPL